MLETAKRQLNSIAQAFADINETLEDALILGHDCHLAYFATGPNPAGAAEVERALADAADQAPSRAQTAETTRPAAQRQDAGS